MITNFERETEELNDFEMEVAQYIAPALRARNKSNPLTNDEIIEKCKELKGWTLNGARVRKIIRWLRMNNQVLNLMATSSGYYVTKSKEEWESYIKSLSERCMSIYSLAEACKKQKKYL